mmetsp:Transcript_22376/g.56464  ORF Transcript_22376/g.56464 Transcript_22376/m.56464 type:complete len:200 (+) Transcript_22376:30-629(+)
MPASARTRSMTRKVMVVCGPSRRYCALHPLKKPRKPSLRRMRRMVCVEPPPAAPSTNTRDLMVSTGAVAVVVMRPVAMLVSSCVLMLSPQPVAAISWRLVESYVAHCAAVSTPARTADGTVPRQRPTTPFSATTPRMMLPTPCGTAVLACRRVLTRSKGLNTAAASAPERQPAVTFCAAWFSIGSTSTSGLYSPMRTAP